MSKIEPSLPPEPNHTNERYCLIQEYKKKGGKTEYSTTYIPWDEFNDSELVELCLHGLPLKEEQEMWKVIHRGMGRELLMDLIRGVESPKQFKLNPVHKDRNVLKGAICEYWKFIHSQVQCDTCCWDCTDLKVLECVLENRELIDRNE